MTLPDMLNDGSNIKLIKEETGGDAFYTADGKQIYEYYLQGALQNLPSNDKFEVKMVAYDAAGKEIKGVDYYDTSISTLKYDADNGDTGKIAYVQSPEPLNISKIEIKVLNPDGKTVFQKTIDFDMENMDLSGLDEKPTLTSTSSVDDNTSLSVNGNSVEYSDENGTFNATEENGVYHYKGNYKGMSYDYKLDKDGNPV